VDRLLFAKCVLHSRKPLRVQPRIKRQEEIRTRAGTGCSRLESLFVDRTDNTPPVVNWGIRKKGLRKKVILREAQKVGGPYPSWSHPDPG